MAKTTTHADYTATALTLTTAAQPNITSLGTLSALTVSGAVAFGSLTDSGESITVTKFVDESDGIGSNDNDTTLPTSAAVKDYVDNNGGPTHKTFGTDSIMVGDNATGTIDAANYNTALGVDVFSALTSGDSNTAIGAYAKLENGKISVEAELFSLDGTKRYFVKSSKEPQHAEKLGKEVGRILKERSNNSYKK